MGDETAFAYELAHDVSLKEVDVVVACAWFLLENKQAKIVALAEVCDFLEEHGIRTNINRSRLRTQGIGRTGGVFLKDGNISLSLKERTALGARYRIFLEVQPPKVRDTILEMRDFENERIYRRALAQQINACRQFEILDGCAVLMRRLMEVLIIDGFEDSGLREKVRSEGSYLPLSGLIRMLLSGQNFKLSRNAKSWITRCKEMGDNAAHSRTYITKKLDIDDFSGSYRALVAELMILKPS